MTATAIPRRPLPTSLDRLLEIEDGVRAIAVRNVPSTLPILDSHFPRFPVLPGVLLLESMISAATLVAGGDGWRLRSAHAVRFRHFVRPGDQVVISASALNVEDAVMELTAAAEVEGRVVATARRLVLERDSGGEIA
jgi:3-hydroxyacyl-[acyl-carrier-protein] dehydratase